MKIAGTIVIGFVVLLAALFFFGYSLCAVSSGVSTSDRTVSVVVALVSLAVIIGGVSAIGRLNKRQAPK